MKASSLILRDIIMNAKDKSIRSFLGRVLKVEIVELVLENFRVTVRVEGNEAPPAVTLIILKVVIPLSVLLQKQSLHLKIESLGDKHTNRVPEMLPRIVRDVLTLKKVDLLHRAGIGIHVIT